MIDQTVNRTVEGRVVALRSNFAHKNISSDLSVNPTGLQTKRPFTFFGEKKNELSPSCTRLVSGIRGRAAAQRGRSDDKRTHSNLKFPGARKKFDICQNNHHSY